MVEHLPGELSDVQQTASAGVLTESVFSVNHTGGAIVTGRFTDILTMGFNADGLIF